MFQDNLPPDLALRDEISNICRVLNVSDLNSNATELFLKFSVFLEGTEKTGFQRYFQNLRQEKTFVQMTWVA
jgi:hypothetical protein